MRTPAFSQAEVFTDRPFAGNPLAILPGAAGLTAAQMQALASEIDLSDTSFVMEPEGDGDARARLHAGPRAALRRAPRGGHRLRACAARLGAGLTLED